MIKKIDVSGLTELSLYEIKKQEVGILSYVADFCEKKGINYLLADGTLLGCIRHKGFIPWDNDIDIWMLRKDYDLFISEWKKEKHNEYYLFAENTEENWYLAFSKILDMKTVAIENGLEYHSQGGAWVDVFPLDAVPDDKKLAEKHLKKCLMYYNLFTARVNLDLFSKNLKKLYHLLRYFAKYKKIDIFRKPSFLYQKLQKQLQSVSSEQNSNVAELVCPVYVKESFAFGFPKKSLSDFEYGDFEGFKFRIPKNYDSILRCFYGDYMVPPPEKDRIDSHNLKVYWRK